MAKIKSAKKRARQAVKRKRRNLAAKMAVKEAFKKAMAAIASKDPNAAKLVRDAASVIDKAAQRGIIHRNKARRKISQLFKKITTAKKK